MRIIYISDQYPVGELNRNGMYIYRTAKELSKDFDIVVIALHPVVPPIIPMLKNIKTCVNIYKEWRLKFPKNPKPPKDLEDVKVIYVKFLRLPRPKFLYTEALGAYFSLKKNIKTLIGNNTLIHANWIFPEGHLARIFSKKLNIPYLVTLRGSEFIYLSDKNFNGKIAQKVFNDAKKITAVAGELRNQAQEKNIDIPEEKFSILNDFYDFSIFEIREKEIEQKNLCVNQEKINILFPGALRKIKNIYLIFKSLLWLKENRSNKFHLYLAGYGYEEENLKVFVNENNLVENVSFLGNQSASSLVSYYNACDLICLPSFSEGFPTVIIEALLCGTPVVASRVGGVAEVITDGKNGYLIDPHELDSLTNGIINCIEKKWDRRALRESVSHLSRESLIQVYKILYNEVVN